MGPRSASVGVSESSGWSTLTLCFRLVCHSPRFFTVCASHRTARECRGSAMQGSLSGTFIFVNRPHYVCLMWTHTLAKRKSKMLPCVCVCASPRLPTQATCAEETAKGDSPDSRRVQWPEKVHDECQPLKIQHTFFSVFLFYRETHKVGFLLLKRFRETR